jgi:tricorn protease
VDADLRRAWRINRDYFCDPGMHGVDWKAMKAGAAFLPSLPRAATSFA